MGPGGGGGADGDGAGHGDGFGADGRTDYSGAGTDGGGALSEPAPTTRFARLTHEQWERTVRDLLRLDALPRLADGFREDPGDDFTFANVHSLSVDEALWSGYQRAAIELAERVTADPDRLAAIVPDEPAGDDLERARQFIRELGVRAYRRPLIEDGADGVDEVEEYLGLFELGSSLYEDTPEFEAGVRLVLEAMLQSPHFLYRVEDSRDVAGEVIPLSGYEVATRLSYLFWGTMPDAELFGLAEAGELTDPAVVAAQAERMLEDPRAEKALLEFHQQLLEVEKFDSISPSSTFFPDAPEQLGEYAQRENELFLRSTLMDRDGGWYDLLTSTDTFVNGPLAGIYGLEGSYGDDFVSAELDASQRRGLFTQVGFLAANASSSNPDPIHRGVFLARHISCIRISAPPDDIPSLPASGEGTNRERIEDLTEQPGTDCASCHEPLINPFGFPFESYDAVGQWRTEDNGFPVDTQGEPMVGGEPTPVDGATDMLDAMAEDAGVHQCYAEHWVEYAFGRHSAEQDAVLIDNLASASVDRASVKELLIDLVSSRAFMTRSTEEL